MRSTHPVSEVTVKIYDLKISSFILCFVFFFRDDVLRSTKT